MDFADGLPFGGLIERIHDAIGLQDMTTDTPYFERGINLRHGYLTEYYVEHEDFVVKLRGWEILDEAASLADAGVIDGSILLMTHRRRRPVR